MSAASTPRLKVSREGIVLIKSFEGFRPRAVRDEAGRWVIGYGHTASAREGLTVGEPDAELLLQYDLLPVVAALNQRIAGPINQHQFDALASFVLSIGVDRFLSSDVLRELNAGHAGGAADALIGWPEAAAPDAHLRRRAAERALFVADPATPVHLADLLAAPLPPPPVEPEPVPAAEARAAAVASLLGEPLPTPAEAPSEAPAPSAPPAADPFADAPAAPATPEPRLVAPWQRFAPYALTPVGPLPGFPVSRPVAPPEPAPELAPEPTPEPEPAAEAPAPVEAVEVPVAPEPLPEPAPPSAAPPVELAPFAAAPVASPFPPIDPPLVLTPATEADFVDTTRAAWPAEQRPDTAPVEDEVLFDEEPTLSVLRHEVEPAQPRRFDWSETGAFMIMGGVGLAAFAASAAAFRRAAVEPSPMHETEVVGWVLALIGVICVGVSSWNLYVRWGRGD